MPLLNAATRADLMLKQFSAVDYTPTTEWNIAAVIAAPDDAEGNGLQEPASASYSRITVANDSDEFELAENGTEVVNVNEWTFAQATIEEWGPVIGFALFDASDEYMGYLPLSSPKYIGLNHTLKIPAGAFIVSMESTPLSIYIEEAVMPTIKTAPDGERFILGVDATGATVWTATDAFGPPSAPVDVVESSGVISWDPPVSDGGTPIISYTVWHSDSDSLLVGFEVLPNDVLTYTPDALSVGVFLITAENSVGSSDPGDQVVIS